MIIFFLVAAMMLALALAFVLIPLLKPRRDDLSQISDESSNVSICKFGMKCFEIHGADIFENLCHRTLLFLTQMLNYA